MHSVTSLEGPQLVRIAVPCAQTRGAIEERLLSMGGGGGGG